MSEQEAQAEAERRYLPDFKTAGGSSARSTAFVAGAVWERARHVPVEVTDEMVERGVEAAKPDFWESRELCETTIRAALSAALGGGE